MKTNNYRNRLALEAECERRTNKLLFQYYLQNKYLIDEYVKEVFRATINASCIYNIPRDAEICDIKAHSVKDGVVTFLISLVDSEKVLYICTYLISLDEIKLFKIKAE